MIVQEKQPLLEGSGEAHSIQDNVPFSIKPELDPLETTELTGTGLEELPKFSSLPQQLVPICEEV